jgi:23S rRNA (uridine2552-2'-O)-methyltransferase
VTYRRKPDYYTRLAHEKSYPARSVFKLEEIDRRLHLLARGDRVLDLGASPGSWMMYILERVGGEGSVAGVDLSPLGIQLPPNACFIQADVMTIGADDIRKGAGERPFDAIVSDLAPRTTGIRHADQERSWILFSRAAGLAAGLLKRGGHFAGKLFFSPRHADAEALLGGMFAEVRTLQPRATRRESKEIFIVGKNFEPAGMT